MFSASDLAILYTDDFKKLYDVRVVNAHDVSLHSLISGHDWMIISNYATSSCHITHRHSNIDPFHRQRGSYKSLQDALTYIRQHDIWSSSKKKRHLTAGEE